MTPTSSPPVSIVTGGAGFLGSHLSDRLLAEGHRVIAIDNLLTGSTDNIAHLAGNPNFEFIHHNVTQYIYLPGRVDYVFHFASPASPIDYLQLPIQTLKVGSLGTHNALGLALARMGRREEAIQQLEEALRLKPGDAEARNNLELARRQSAPPPPGSGP